MVDTGWNVPQAFDTVEGGLRSLGLGFRDISHILITHVHPDHYGLAGRLKELSGAKLILHQLEKYFIESRYMRVDALVEEMGWWMAINGVPEQKGPGLERASLPMINLVTPVMPDVVLRGGETFSFKPFEFEVLWTPGHSPGHVCLYERKRRLLFSGDHILPIITPNVSLHVQSRGNPLLDYVESLRAVRDLEVEMVFPAHEHLFQGLAKRVDEILHHHEGRKAAILAVLGGSWKTAYEVSSVIPWMEGKMKWEELNILDRRIAVTETLAHLELLRGEGTVSKLQEDGVVHYKVQVRGQ